LVAFGGAEEKSNFNFIIFIMLPGLSSILFFAQIKHLHGNFSDIYINQIIHQARLNLDRGQWVAEIMCFICLLFHARC
jgi:hypothetical protein